MFWKTEIVARGAEDALVHSLAAAMNARGFSLLGIVAVRDTDGALATFGDASVTQSEDFAAMLRCLAEQIELASDDGAMSMPAGMTIPSV